MRNESIDRYKKSVSSIEGLVAIANANSKIIYQQLLAESKKQLKEAEDPRNAMMPEYAQGYPTFLKSFQDSYTQQLNAWETEYSTKHLLFNKKRFYQFLEETKDIDFTASLSNKDTKQVFGKATIEGKSKWWKMAFRAWKNVIMPSREFVQNWLEEIK